MDEGCQIRELPDGGREFVLEDPSLSFIRIDHQSRLQFGRCEVVIASPFAVQMGGLAHHLHPHHTEGLGPLLALFPGTVRWLWTSTKGQLNAVFVHGATLTVPPHPVTTAWSVGSVYCLPTDPG